MLGDSGGTIEARCCVCLRKLIARGLNGGAMTLVLMDTVRRLQVCDFICKPFGGLNRKVVSLIMQS